MIKFGTGGWRAIIGDDFIRSNIQVLAKAMCDKMRNENVQETGMVIGYDRRFLSKEAMQWAAQVFAAEGIKTRLINYSVPTPVVMFYVMRHRMKYGMMITASHNPALYNGIKIFTEGGRDAEEEQTCQIEEYCKDIDPCEVEVMDYDRAVEEGLIEEIYPFYEYLDNIFDTINMEMIRSKRMRIALDPLYGVSGASLRTILLTARCEVDTMHENHDTLFGGHLPAPNEETLRPLQNYVTAKHFDMGVATDGDGDRLGVIDDTGQFLHPNEILLMLYYYLLKYKGWHGPAVRNIATTHMLDRLADFFGEECYEVPVGFKYISAMMQEKDAVIGGESSGGLTVRGHIHGKDGVYAASLLVEMVAVTGKKLSELLREVKELSGAAEMVEYAFRFSTEKKADIEETLMKDKLLPGFDFPVEKVSYMDGCKVYFQNGGWVIARFSGTEPLLRIFSEMPSREMAVQNVRRLEEFLKL